MNERYGILRGENATTCAELTRARANNAEEIFRRRLERLERLTQQMSATEATMVRTLRNINKPEFADQLSNITMFLHRECDQDFPPYMMQHVRQFHAQMKRAHDEFSDSFEFYDRKVIANY